MEVGWLILRCDLYADKFISMPLHLGRKPLGYWLIALSQWVVLREQSHALCRRQTKSPWVGGGFDLSSGTRCVLTGPLFWVAVTLLPVLGKLGVQQPWTDSRLVNDNSWAAALIVGTTHWALLEHVGDTGPTYCLLASSRRPIHHCLGLCRSAGPCDL